MNYSIPVAYGQIVPLHYTSAWTKMHLARSFGIAYWLTEALSMREC